MLPKPNIAPQTPSILRKELFGLVQIIMAVSNHVRRAPLYMCLCLCLCCCLCSRRRLLLRLLPQLLLLPRARVSNAPCRAPYAAHSRPREPMGAHLTLPDLPFCTLCRGRARDEHPPRHVRQAARQESHRADTRGARDVPGGGRGGGLAVRGRRVVMDHEPTSRIAVVYGVGVLGGVRRVWGRFGTCSAELPGGSKYALGYAEAIWVRYSPPRSRIYN